MDERIRLADIDIVVPTLKRRFTGVTASVTAVLPHQVGQRRVAAAGRRLPVEVPTIGVVDLIASGWQPPEGRSHRVWHARRNVEMIAGVILRDLLRQPWRLVFTSAAQRRHSWITRLLLSRMDAVIAPCPAAASYLKRPATIVSHGVDTAKLKPADDRAAAMAALGLAGKRAIGIFGRTRAQKGTDLFIDALIELLPRHPDWIGVIVGPTSEAERTFLAALMSRLASAGLASRVLHVGEVPHAEVARWMAAMSVIVAPARHEGFGLVPLEAMAAGTPVIASTAGAHASGIIDGKTGWLVPAADGPALASAMDAAMGLAPAAIDAIGRAGRARVEASFSIQHEAAAIGEVYARLLGRADSASASAIASPAVVAAKARG